MEKYSKLSLNYHQIPSLSVLLQVSGSSAQKAPDSLSIPLGVSGGCNFLLQHSLVIFSMFSCSEAKSISMSFEYGENGEQESGVNTTIRSLVISLTCQYLPLTRRRSVRAHDEGTSIQMYSLHQIKAKCGSTRSLKVKNLNSLCTVMNKALICQLHFFSA